MAKLTTEQRKGLRGEAFGLPDERKYPMPGRVHAANAKARAAQQFEKGNLSGKKFAKVKAKANEILGL
jgi:hypothetical protein